MKNELIFWETATDSLVKHLKTMHWYKKEMIKYIEKYLSSGDTLLDIGCGPGAFISDLSRIVGNKNLTSVDYSDKMIYEAKNSNHDAIVKYGDIRNLRFEDNKFDASLCFGVLQSMPLDYKTAISEMKRVSKKYIFIGELMALPGVDTHGRLPVGEDRSKLDWVAYNEDEFKSELAPWEILSFERTQRTHEKNGLGEGDVTVIVCKR